MITIDIVFLKMDIAKIPVDAMVRIMLYPHPAPVLPIEAYGRPVYEQTV